MFNVFSYSVRSAVNTQYLTQIGRMTTKKLEGTFDTLEEARVFAEDKPRHFVQFPKCAIREMYS